MTDRKNELATMCAVEIRKTSALAKSHMADYGYHLIESVVDAEMSRMIHRLSGKPVTEADLPLLRELVMEDLWPRLRETHREQRDAAFERLISGDNDIIVSEAEFAFDTGWIPLVDEAVERMRTYPESWEARIVGGKEKFGCLVLHIACDYDQPGCRSEVERLREEIRLRSLATCDICGKQGRLRLGSYAKTVCDTHAAVLGDLREDDGVWADPWHWRAEQPIEDHIADVVTTAREIMAAADEAEIADVQAGLDELDRGEHVDIDDVIAKARAIVDAADEMDESNDPMRMTDLGKRIDDDTWQRRGREQELLIEFGYYIKDAVNGALIKPEYLDDYISKELSGWSTYARVPLSDSDREWLHRYIRELIDAEYERVKGK